MTLQLQDAFDIPQDVGALGFVVSIADGAKSREALLAEYVLTPGVQKRLPDVLRSLQHPFDKRGGEVGWFVHGSFGAGKSHFMAFLGALLEDDEAAWAKLAAHKNLAALAGQHRGWIRERRLLVVRENLLSAAGPDKRFDSLVYGAVNRALQQAGQATFEYLDVQPLLDEARREAQDYGPAFWQRMESAGIVGSQAEFDVLAEGPPQGREGFARAYLEHKGRSVAGSGFNRAWAPGLKALATHVQGLGYGGIVYLLDEMLLWLSGLSGPQYKEAVNQLNVMVDHADGRRDLPMAVFVARQRRFRDFFPDMTDQDQLQDHLDHHSGRFELLTLEDVELRFICKERILRPKQPAAVTAAVDRLVAEQGRILPTLLQNADEAYLRDVHPFHPALIEALIDISALMQRDRTALRLLYELLRRNAQLPLGQLIPVGDAFDAVFTGADFGGDSKVDRLRAVQRLYQERLAPALQQMSADLTGEGFDAPRAQALGQLLKTALVAEVSPRLRGPGRMTVERLVRLNHFFVPGETEKGRMGVAARDLAELGRRVPALQVNGQAGAAEVSVSLVGADFGEILERAKGQVESPNRRFRTFYQVLLPLLGLQDQPGYGAGEDNDGVWDSSWRGTRRRGSLCLTNVRELPYERFRVREGGEFRLIIDYPWDEPGHTVEEDRQRTQNCRQAQGQSNTLVWLPRHFSEREIQTLHDLAASEFIGSEEGQARLLGSLSAADRQRAVEQAADRARGLRQEVEAIIRRAYQDHGEVLALTSDIPAKVPHPDLQANLHHFAAELLDRRYPQHPRFGAEPRAAELERLLDWMCAAAETADQRAPFDNATLPALQNLGHPLELADLGQRAARLRLDTRYMQEVLRQLESSSLLWRSIDERLEDQFGLQPLVRSLFLLFVLRARGYRALQEQTGRPAGDLVISAKPLVGLRLERAELLDLPAWSRARELGAALFGLTAPPATPNLAAQDSWAEQLRAAGHQQREQLETLLARLRDNGWVAAEAARLAELHEAVGRLKPLDDTRLDAFGTLKALVTQWPSDAGDSLRQVVRQAGAALEAVKALDASVLKQLQGATSSPTMGPQARAMIDEVKERLGAGQLAGLPSAKELQGWTDRARALMQRLIEAAAAQRSVVQPPESPADGAAARPAAEASAQDAAASAFARDGQGMAVGTDASGDHVPPPAASALPGRNRLIWQGEVIDPRDPEQLKQAVVRLGQALRRLAKDGNGRLAVDVTVRLLPDADGGEAGLG